MWFRTFLEIYFFTSFCIGLISFGTRLGADEKGESVLKALLAFILAALLLAGVIHYWV